MYSFEQFYLIPLENLFPHDLNTVLLFSYLHDNSINVGLGRVRFDWPRMRLLNMLLNYPCDTYQVIQTIRVLYLFEPLS